MRDAARTVLALMTLVLAHCGPPPDQLGWLVAIEALETPVFDCDGQLGRWLQTSEELVFEFDSQRRIRVLETVDIRGVPYGGQIQCRGLDRTSRPVEQREYLKLFLGDAESPKSSALGYLGSFCPDD